MGRRKRVDTQTLRGILAGAAKIGRAHGRRRPVSELQVFTA